MAHFPFKFGLLPKCIIYLSISSLEYSILWKDWCYFLWTLSCVTSGSPLHFNQTPLYLLLTLQISSSPCLSWKLGLPENSTFFWPDNSYWAVDKSGSQNQSWVSAVRVAFSIVLNQIGKGYSLFFSFHSSHSINNCILFSLSN